MNSADKAALRAYAVQSLCHEIKATVQALWMRFKEIPLESWPLMKCIAQQIVVVAERVDGLGSSDSTSIRPRKATFKEPGPLGELRDLLDLRVRMTTSKMDQLIQQLDSSTEQANEISAELQNVKTFVVQVAPLLYNSDSDSTEHDETFEADLCSFLKLIRDYDAKIAEGLLPASDDTLGGRFAAEVLQRLPKQSETEPSSNVPVQDQKKPSKSPLAFLRQKVSGFLNGSGNHSTEPASAKPSEPPLSPKEPEQIPTSPRDATGAKKPPAVPARPKLPLTHSQGKLARPPPVPPKSPRLAEEPSSEDDHSAEQPAASSPRQLSDESSNQSDSESREQPSEAAQPDSAGSRSPSNSNASSGSSPQSTSTSTHGPPVKESSVSKKLKGAASSFFRKAQKAAASVRSSVSHGSSSHIRSASDNNSTTSPASPRAAQGNAPTYSAPPAQTGDSPPPSGNPNQASSSIERSIESSSPSGTPPESPREYSSEEGSLDLFDPSKPWSSARSSRQLHPLNKRGSGKPTQDDATSSLSTSTQTPRSNIPALTPEETALREQKKLEQQREDALQREVLDKFNLDGRIAQNDTRPSGGSTRERRRAAIFTKAVDRYSQLHSNVEEPRSSAEVEQEDVNIWDEPVEGNIKIDSHDGKQEVAAGTLNQLVKHLTSDQGLDGRFVHTFLLTYTSFTTPRMLLEKLKQRYQVPESVALSSEPTSTSSPLSASSDSTPHSDSIASVSTQSSASLVGADPKKKLQLRIINTLKKWLDVSFLDFNDELIGQVFEFVDLLKKDGNASLAAVIDNMLLTKLVGIRKKKERAYDSPPPPPIIPKVPTDQLTFEDIEVIELARQMTIFDHETYTNIKASELLRQAWNKPHLRHRSPRVLEMIERFNSISKWVAGSVVRPETAKERARVYERFVLLAQQLRVLNNFNGMNAILSGLGSSAVFRLQTTKELLSNKIIKKYDKLHQLMNSSSNFANYRAALRAATPPAVPYLGHYLSALVFIEEGNQDFMNAGTPEAPRQLINFKKRRLVSRVIEEMRAYQVGGYYALIPVPSIVDFLANLPEESEDQLYELSLIREPRKKTN